MRKKWSAAFRLVKMTAVKSARLIRCSLRTSRAGTPSTWMKALKSSFRLYFCAKAKYGDFSFSGLGNVTKMLFTFFALSASDTCMFFTLITKYLNQYKYRSDFEAAKIHK